MNYSCFVHSSSIFIGSKAIGQVNDMSSWSVLPVLLLIHNKLRNKKSGVDSKCSICIWQLLTGILIMWSKEGNQVIIRMKKLNKSERQQKLQEWTNQQFGSFLKKRKALVSPGTPKSLGRTWKATIVDDFLGKEKLLHNIQPNNEHSQGGRPITVIVYNQETPS